MSTNPTAQELPSPEADILKSKFFLHFKISGGPHLDALLYNQATIMMLIQDIRLIQYRNIGTGPSAAEISAGDIAGGRVARFAEEVKTILGNKAQKDILSGLLKKWLEQDKVNNRVAGNRRNGRLAVWSQSWWSFCKEKLAAWWDREDDHWDMTEDDDRFYHELIPTLNTIDQSTYDVEELYLAIGKIALDKQATTGSKRKRVSGGAAASASSSTPATASTGGDQDEGETSEEIQSRRRSNQRSIGGRSVSGASLGGDATYEDSDDAAFGHDDLYDSDEVLQEYMQETVRLRKKNNRLSIMFDKAKTSGNWGLVEEAIKQKDDDEVDEATRARLAQLRMG